MNEPVLLPKFKPLWDRPKHRYYLLTGGRGSAKSFHVAYFLLWLTYDSQHKHVILFTRWTLTSAHISIIPEFVEKIELLNASDHFEIKQTEIVNKITGNRIVFRGIKTSQGTATANLKSIQGVTTWVIDEAEELIEREVFDRIDLSIRQADTPNRVIMVMNPSYTGHFIYQDFIANKRDDTLYIHTSYEDNKANLSQSFIDQAERTKQTNIHRYEHLFEGKWLEDQEGLLWNRAIIERCRITAIPDLTRIVVAIDPAVTNDPSKSDETGIIVAGKDAHGNGYLLEDASGHYSPIQWASEAKRMVDKWGADCYVAEKNQGGDMVESVLRQVDQHTRVKLVTATKGKFVRAEPVFSFYQQNRIFHAGQFPKLEAQMITFNPDKSKQSPDRVDALVWGFTDLIQPETVLFSFS